MRQKNVLNFLKTGYINLLYNPQKSISDSFCVLLTASINPNGCTYLKRSNPKLREQDYLDSLKLWLNKTNFKIVFCENSGYNLENITELCKKYPGRVEIIQFYGNNYPRHLGKGYGEFKIIERALRESLFIRSSKNIIKVTGRIFIKNIYNVIRLYSPWSIVWFSRGACIKTLPCRTIIFIFKKNFFIFLKKYSSLLNDSKGFYFEHAFYSATQEAIKLWNNLSILINIKYIWYSATLNRKYTIDETLAAIRIFLQSRVPKIHYFLKMCLANKKL